jgi:hypothetical protein
MEMLEKNVNDNQRHTQQEEFLAMFEGSLPAMQEH